MISAMAHRPRPGCLKLARWPPRQLQNPTGSSESKRFQDTLGLMVAAEETQKAAREAIKK